jgi:hypothetical protein
METALRAGMAIYNAGEFHAAHDAWEDTWLDLERGSEDERLLHGLIQFTAATYHATEGNLEGARGLAASAREYLDGLEGYRGVNVGEIRDYLEGLATDPGSIETADAPELTVEGVPPTLDTAPFEVAVSAARVIAKEYSYDEEVLESAIEYARRDLANGKETSPFVAGVLDFARDSDNRGIVAQRLGAHVERRAARESDLEGLFET